MSSLVQLCEFNSSSANFLQKQRWIVPTLKAQQFETITAFSSKMQKISTVFIYVGSIQEFFEFKEIEFLENKVNFPS
jgi:hypothetical protein